jgi:hypothetical protein
MAAWGLLPASDTVSFVTGLICMLAVFTLIPICVKRLHDLDITGWWVLVFLVVYSFVVGGVREQISSSIGSIALFVAVVWLGSTKGETGGNRHGPAREADRQGQQQNVREANRLLKDINKSLGFPEGQGPTGIMVDGQYTVVNVGHTERMKNDPVYAWGNEIAGIMTDITDLENALKEAQASNNTALARSISNELQALERKANEMIDKQQRERPRS